MTDTLTELAPWVLTWRGFQFREAQLKGKHLAIISLITGRDDFEQIEIRPDQGHQRLMMMIATIVASERAESAETADPDELATIVATAIDEVSSAGVDEILGALTFDNI